MSNSLIALVNESQELINQLIASDGVVSPELESSLAIIEAKLPAKIDSYAMVLERLEAEALYWKEKSKQYSKIASGCENARERIKDALKAAAEQMGVDELKGVDIRFKISNVKPKLIVDQAALSDDYLTQTVTFAVDNEKVRADLEAGKDVNGAKFHYSKSIRSYLNPKGSAK